MTKDVPVSCIKDSCCESEVSSKISQDKMERERENVCVCVFVIKEPWTVVLHANASVKQRGRNENARKGGRRKLLDWRL